MTDAVKDLLAGTVFAKAVYADSPGSGSVVWTEEGGYSDFQSDLNASLPVNADAAKAPYGWVCDVSLDRSKCLISWSPGDGEDCTSYVAGILTDADGEPRVAPQAEWVEVQQQYVAKALPAWLPKETE